jgi:hypothetical protein
MQLKLLQPIFLRGKANQPVSSLRLSCSKQSIIIPYLDESKVKKEGDSGYLTFATFDINRVLERGAPLLASGGAVRSLVSILYWF